MNIKNVIKRCGVVFIFIPSFICLNVINIIIWLTTIIWGPFYYIITGKDPVNIEFNILSEYFTDWYFDKFGPDE